MTFDIRKYLYETAVPRAIGTIGWGMPVDIIFASGNDQEQVNAQVLYDTEQIDPESGDLISVNNTWITFAKASLDEEINQGDKAYFKFPTRPGSTVQIAGMLDGSKAIIDGKSLGFIRIPITDVEQS
ncbi:MAG: hypothetical protein P8X74_03595 [Reinekea sp.]